MALFGIGRARRGAEGALAGMLAGFSIEVTPRTAAKVPDFRALLPQGTRIYVAHIDGTPIEDMVATARRIAAEGFPVMPHVPARSVPDAATLADWIARYRGEAGVTGALLLAGGRATPAGALCSSMDLVGTGLFDGFARLHFAGHPEGNRDIDPDGSDRGVMEALRWKQALADRTDAAVALVTQFAFEAGPVIAWADRLREAGISLPIHLGLAGPAKLQTLIRHAVACGVGPSLRVLQARAVDVTRLVLPYAPTDVAAAIAAHRRADPASLIAQIHLFPLGGVQAAADWAREHGQTSPALRAAP